MKKKIFLIGICMLLSAALAGCGKPASDNASQSKTEIMDKVSAEPQEQSTNPDGEEAQNIDDEIDLSVRPQGDDEWSDSVDAKAGSIIECQIHYKNKSDAAVKNVIIRASLPDNLEYVEDSTKLYNTAFPDGSSTDDNTLVTDGVNAGDYSAGGDAYVRFQAEVVDVSMEDGNNRLIIWGKVSAGDNAGQASADIYVNR